MQRKPFQNAVWQAIDTILPPRCVVSGEVVEHQGMLSGEAWGALNFIAAPQCEVCGFPFDYDIDVQTGMTSQGEALCAGCLGDKPEFRTARAAVAYDDGSRGLVLSFKHGDQMHLVRAFTPWLMKSGGEMLAQADIIAPVPLHRWRIIKRRYNQAALISKALAEAANKPHAVDLLIRKRSTPPQGHLKHAERAKNVRKAFVLSAPYVEQVQGARIVLIDDVYTTGATVRECSKVLLKAGASRVDVLTLARVLKS